jgi:hypothetical protein
VFNFVANFPRIRRFFDKVSDKVSDKGSQTEVLGQALGQVGLLVLYSEATPLQTVLPMTNYG